MRKKDKLYKVNKWNQPLFAQGIDREHQNIFDGLTQSTLNTPSSYNATQPYYNSSLSSLTPKTEWYTAPQLAAPTVAKPVNWSDSLQSKMAVADSQNTVNKFHQDIQSYMSNNTGNGNDKWAGVISAGKAAAMSLADNIQIGNSKRGLWDAADPVYHLAGGRESAVGNGLSDAGVGLFKAGAQTGNLPLMAAGAGAKVLGGLTNAAFGIKTDKERLNAINTGVDKLKNFKSDASSFDDVQGPDAIVDNTRNVYEGGWFSGGKAKRKNTALKNKVLAAETSAYNSVDNNISNITGMQRNNLLANYAAFGGQLDNQGAIDYGFMSDYLTNKKKAAEAKDKINSGNAFGALQTTPFSTFALGGVLQTNGGDFGNLVHIDEGGSHEENPYDGVQMGISRENDQPNLVEEGETVFDDYVFPKRIKADAKTKKIFHVGKNSDISYADLSKRLEKESLERPNDPLSQAALKKQMHLLAENCERQKEEMQAKEAQEAFAQLSPEQQQALMQQMAMEEQQIAQAQQEQQAQQLSAEQQQQLAQQEQPDTQQVLDEQMQQQQPQQPQMEEVQMAACGGKLNRFDKGGDMKRRIYKALGLYTDDDFDKWAYDQKLDKVTDWENILQNKQFLDAISGSNPALSDAISKGYDFGAYVPSKNNKLTFDFKHGGWGLEDYNSWNGSTDAAWQEAVKKGLVKEGMNSEEIGKALSQTDAYKRGSDWLKADENNRLTYLQLIFNSADAPQAARDYAAKYVDANGWLKDAKKDYQTIFEDPNGTGVRNTHPGTYWKTPNEVLREKQAMNYEVADDGSIHEIIGDVPKGWTNVGTYNWQDASNDYGYNYYKRPGAAAKDNAKPVDEEYEPVHKSTWGRTAGLFGPVVGLGMQMAGIGKPDYSKLDASIEAASGSPALAHYKPIGNYLTYRPMDIWYEQNRLNANSRATDRAILNNASPTTTKMAGLLANNYNNQIGSGNLFRQALEYNDAQRQKVAEFNRGTDMFNAQAFNQTSATNAQLKNSHRNFKAQLLMDAARQRMAADAAWNQGIYGNVSALFKGLGDWGKENAQHNMIADMAADGLFGTMSDKQHIGKDHLRKKNSAAKGGKLNRKKGLTF